jgi:cytochrome d ubiquinol oxidase subunit II
VSAADAVAAVLWLGVTLYALFGGADFGAGFWDLVAGGDRRGERPRALIEHSIAPVWEANHVWLIFVLVISWTAFGVAASSVMTTLFIPLALAALGIVLRGAGFAFRKVARTLPGRRAAGAAFALSTLLTPFFLGTAIGAIAAERVPVGNAAGDAVSSWLNLTGITIGILLVASCAYLAAVYLTVDARRFGDAEMERYFRARAIGAAVFAGLVAFAGLFVLRENARYLYDGLTDEALPLVIASALFGAIALVLLVRGAPGWTRVFAAGAVTAVIWGWAIAQHPYLLPQELTINEAAGAEAALVSVLVVFGVALLVVAPSLGLLYVLDQRSMLGEDAERENSEHR